MTMKTITMTLLLALSTLASARIGETKAECEERYGSPTEVDELGTHYLKHGYRLILQFDSDGACALFSAQRLGQPKLTDKEIAMFLAGNGDDWGDPIAEGVNIRWHGSGVVGYVYKRSIVFVFESSYAAKLKDEAAERERELLITF